MARCKSNRVVVVGDFNFPFIDWDSLSDRGVAGGGFLKQCVDSPAREGAILYLVLGDEPGQVVDVSGGEQFGNSDRNSVSLKVPMQRCQPVPTKNSTPKSKKQYF